MPMLSDKDRTFLQDHLAKSLTSPVKLLFFTQTIACQFCEQTEQVLTELAELSDKVTLDIYNFVTDKEVADEYGIDKIPATVVMSEIDYGVRFYGIPSGYEFTSLVEDVVDISNGRSGLSAESVDLLSQVTEPVHMQVFITPT